MTNIPGRKTTKKVLKFLDKHRISSNPQNYLLFYNYFLGKPKRAAAIVKSYIGNSGSYLQKSLNSLYNEIYGKESIDDQLITVNHIIKKINQELTSISKVADYFDRNNSLIFRRLAKYPSFLRGKGTAKAVKQVIPDILDDIKKIQLINNRLTQRVDGALQTIKKLSIELKKAKIESMYDSLTGLYNRRVFDVRLGEEINRFNRYGTDFSLAFLDVDRLKMINDSFGHVSGDILLKDVALKIKNNKRNSDIAARYGGDEFAIIFPNTKLDGGFQASKKYLKIIQKGHIILKRKKVKPSVSIGVVQMKKGMNDNQLIDIADKAMYLAKHSLKNVVYTEKDLKDI